MGSFLFKAPAGSNFFGRQAVKFHLSTLSLLPFFILSLRSFLPINLYILQKNGRRNELECISILFNLQDNDIQQTNSVAG
jgi:hypothetical protein